MMPASLVFPLLETVGKTPSRFTWGESYTRACSEYLYNEWDLLLCPTLSTSTDALERHRESYAEVGAGFLLQFYQIFVGAYWGSQVMASSRCHPTFSAACLFSGDPQPPQSLTPGSLVVMGFCLKKAVSSDLLDQVTRHKKGRLWGCNLKWIIFQT